MIAHELAQSLDQNIRGSNIIIKIDGEKVTERIDVAVTFTPIRVKIKFKLTNLMI